MLPRAAKAVARLCVGKLPVSRAAHVVGERHRAMFSSESGQAGAPTLIDERQRTVRRSIAMAVATVISMKLADP